ncbi:dTMP kinase [candidate division WOR-1 bacterium RIFOXYA12_FULL_43_27]|uniref:Thymidylate kinase n=1 Tax=candidate division WOR-1 bacterium RIFOXYC2_FULL_46_14 TaxID=1802587 RepID=A0A1F4U3M2_UNCSA|nr:MAG: dTMP kinase [candidate division WOR-1 bacterium RIFOXYA12_FULL_43_27]OGC20915.1 MAG: dTMP kinase [candidate division WOR-1 bacterium RIFOXYB2_FULL_46_45]OGC32164.1 MAG: dTMP kinase [candidate division WOR-1 bacterium RIFOXYA2_FULL_46_56]OGC39564.1 MAG: dTMP kinase [candidate division WOR-1 bacterium RIFOXYC2_FULL_46_14]
MLITFEGGEGSGKSTQIRLLEKYLAGLGKKVLSTAEPGGTELGYQLRKILLTGEKPDPLAELLLFAADRAEHVAKVIKPALEKGRIVLSDRYFDSTVAYQIGGRGLSVKTVEFLNQLASGGLKPDLTFLLDLPVEEGLKRALVETKFEREELSFHQRVRKMFLKIAAQDPKRVKVIDSTAPVTEVQEEIQKLCKAKIFGKRS